MLKDKRKAEEKQAQAEELESRLVKYLKPVLSELNEKMDRRLVKTLLGLVMAIVMHRDRNNGLLLSELGGFLLGSDACQAGTKRISNLLHSQKWTGGEIEKFRGGTARARRTPVGDLGRERSGKVREFKGGETVCSAFKQSQASKAHQAWFLQSARRTSRLCARLSLVEVVGDRT